MPSIAGLVHQELGLCEDCFSADINMACGGFVGALILAEKYLKDNESALIIASEKISDCLDFKDRSTAILFGDGCAGATVTKNNKLWASVQRTYRNDKSLYMERNGKLSMEGNEIFRFAVGSVPDAIECLLDKCSLCDEDIKYVFSHQANIRIIEKVSKRLGISQERFLSNVDEYGNTSAASIPILLSENTDRLAEGDKIIFTAFGAGLVVCSAVMEW